MTVLSVESSPYLPIQPHQALMGSARLPLATGAFSSADVFQPSVHFSGSDRRQVNQSTTRKKSIGARLHNFFILDPTIKFMALMAVHPKVARFVYGLQSLFSSTKNMPMSEIKRYLGVKPEKITVQSLGRTIDGSPINLKCYWVEGKTKHPKTKKGEDSSLTIPWNKHNNEKTIVFGHGITQDWRAMVGIAKPFIDAGYNAFFINFRAHGESGGGRTSFGFHESEDLAAAIKWVKTNEKDRSQKLIYHGFSLGANAVLFAHKSLSRTYENEYDDLVKRIDALILDTPTDKLSHFVTRAAVNHIASRPAGRIMRFFGAKNEYKNLSKRMIELLENKGPQLLKLQNDITDDDLLEEFQKDNKGLAKKPILFLHGTEDEVVGWSQGTFKINEDYPEGAESRYKAFKVKRGNDVVRIAALEGQGHGGVKWKPYINDPKEGNRKKEYWSAMRGGNNYITPVKDYLNDLPSLIQNSLK